MLPHGLAPESFLKEDWQGMLSLLAGLGFAPVPNSCWMTSRRCSGCPGDRWLTVSEAPFVARWSLRCRAGSMPWKKRIAARVRQAAPALAAMAGCVELTAAKIAGEAAGVTRFNPRPGSPGMPGLHRFRLVRSGNTAGRVRMTRPGTRQLNAAWTASSSPGPGSGDLASPITASGSAPATAGPTLQHALRLAWLRPFDRGATDTPLTAAAGPALAPPRALVQQRFLHRG